MAESTGSAILWVHGNSHILDGSGLTEEFVNSIFRSVESKVTTEDSVGLTWGSTGWASHSGLLARELAGNLSVVKEGTVALLACLLGIGVVLELNETNSLGVSLRHD